MAFAFTVASVDQTIFEGDVYSVTLPGVSGELTVMANHMPFISTLKKGEVKIRTGRNADLKTVPIRGGLLEVANNSVIVLV